MSTVAPIALASLASATIAAASALAPAKAEAAGPRIESETLLEGPLAVAEGTEFAFDRCRLPPGAELATHWHPGEELAYVLEGEVTLSLEGEPDLVVRAGDAAKVPFKHVHKATAGKDGALVLVIRVHEAGQPTRVLVK